MILKRVSSVKAAPQVVSEPTEDRVVKLLAELKAAYEGFTWESDLQTRDGSRRSPYRTLVLFGLSARTRDALLVEMCRRFFGRFPNAGALSACGENLEGMVADIVRPGQMPFVASMALALGDGVPQRRETLLGINGVGEKIAECVLAYGWGEDALPLDVNCIRVLARVSGQDTKQLRRMAPAPLRESLKCVYLKRTQQFKDLSIGMIDMHEILRLHGQVCCTRTPECDRCPVRGCLSRREPSGRSEKIEGSPAIWDDWRELINEPASV